MDQKKGGNKIYHRQSTSPLSSLHSILFIHMYVVFHSLSPPCRRSTPPHPSYPTPLLYSSHSLEISKLTIQIIPVRSFTVSYVLALAFPNGLLMAYSCSRFKIFEPSSSTGGGIAPLIILKMSIVS